MYICYAASIYISYVSLYILYIFYLQSNEKTQEQLIKTERSYLVVYYLIGIETNPCAEVNESVCE